jgi:phosphomevalonate kinase
VSFRLTVPGNLLLAGEYALLEEGGLGAAIAVEPRLVVTVFPASEWELVGRWPGTEERWTPEMLPTFAGDLFLSALNLLTSRGDTRERRYDRAIAPARIELDSSALFDPQGRKRGFGSSAAIAVGITATLAQLQGREDPTSVYQIAVAAHRSAQRGAGSGYDVSASFFGGFGLFTGGATPSWTPLDSSVLPWMAVFAGPKAVKTTSSIALYRAWQAQEPHAAGAFVEQSNAAVKTLAPCRAWPELREAWRTCRTLGADLGEVLGSSAQLALPPSFPPDSDSVFYKALGAGNETGLAAGEAGVFGSRLPEMLEPVQLAPEGLLWE